jgi:transposase
VPSYESSMSNLRQARASRRWRPPRPWRSKEESRAIRRFVFQWLTCRDRSRPSARAWARGLGVSHTWVQKLVSEFRKDAREMLRLQATRGEPNSSDLSRAQECTRRMRERGELRPRHGRLD